MAENEPCCGSPEPNHTAQINSSIKYLNEFKQIELLDGTISTPIGIELSQLRIAKYKQFLSDRSLPLNKQLDNGYVFDLAGSLTTLVGPNNSGKTTLLKAVQLFCQAVKYGSGDYSFDQAKEFFGIEELMFDVLLQGSFTVHYQDTKDTKELKLNVALARPTGSCKEDVKYWKIGSQFIGLRHSVENNVHVCVTRPNAELTYHGTSNSSPPCLTSYRRVSISKNDYTVLENLFPQVTPFNSKSVFSGSLRSLFDQIPKIRNYKENINAEITRIFPSIRINYEEEVDVEKLPRSKRIDREICTKERNTPLLGTGGKQLSIEGEIFDQHVENIDVCSEGVLQCLSLIITICCAEPNSIITIDEPDSHVFPNAQKLLINFFHRKLKEFRLSNRFCQMIITTHSPDIMQAVELKEIRKIFPNPHSHIRIEIKSLLCLGQLLSVMTTLGTSILSHDEIVRLSDHRKLLYLESSEDFDFMSGIIRRVQPELLSLPFTILHRYGRPKPDDIKQLISGFQSLIPKNSTISIFVLVDSDLRREKKLQNEMETYALLEADKKLTVKVYYHCWAVREWENWLLFNENLLFDMLLSNELAPEKSIKILRQQINNNYPQMLGAFQLNQSTTTTAATTTGMSQSDNVKEQFLQWFKTELFRHYELFLNEDLTLSRMEGSGKNDEWDQKELADEGRKFLHKAGIDDEQMKKIFGKILIPILPSIGAQNRKHNGQQTQSQTDEENDYLKQCQNKWLDERQIKQPINLDDQQVRKTLTKWIDAKRFFYQLTHDRNIMVKTTQMFLDKYWKEAFSLEPSDKNYLYSRYFNQLDPADQHKWPEDFSKLLKKFEQFIKTP